MAKHYTRRDFIKKTALWTAAGTVPLAGTARAMGTDPVLVSVFLRGGADSLNICVPYGDDNYAANRPNIKIKAEQRTDLDGFFALNNAFQPLVPLFQNNELGIVHCAGSRHETRSHFEAMDYMEAAIPGSRSSETGWLQRALYALSPSISHAGISIGKQVNQTMRGNMVPTTTMRRIVEHRRQRKNLGDIRASLAELYPADTHPVLGGAVSSAFESLDILADISTDTDVEYPSTTIARSLREVAALIKADQGVRIVALDLGGWDHHTDEVNRMNTVGANLAGALAAFRQDLGEDFNRTMLLTMTEFGRTVKENGNDGTDHGHGSMMMGLGGRLVGAGGGKVLLGPDGWPGLALENLNRERFLTVRTDFRDVFAEVLDKHMGLGSNLGQILPGHSLTSGYPGLI